MTAPPADIGGDEDAGGGRAGAPAVAVIGGGVLGSLIAAELARRRCRVTLIDPTDHRPGAPRRTATQLSFGWVTALSRDPAEDPEDHARRRAGIARWHALQARLGGRADRPVIGARACRGAVLWRVDPAETRALADRHLAAGAEVSAVERPELIGGRLGPSAPDVAILAPGEVAFDPASTARRIVEIAQQRARLRVLQGMVEAVHPRRDGGFELALHRPPAGRGGRPTPDRLRADRVVIAAGVGGDALAARFSDLPPTPRAPAALVRLRVRHGMPDIVLAPPGFELRPDGPDMLLMAREAPAEDGPAARAALVAAARADLRDFLPGLPEPGLSEAAIVQRPMPAGGLLVRPLPGAEGMVLALAHPGVTLAPEAAERAAALVVPEPRDARSR